MMVETARQHEISSVEFSSTMLEPTGKSEFSKSARFGCERAEHFGIGAPKIFITSHGELIAPKGISMCNPVLLSAPRTRFLRFQPREETLNTLIYRRSYDDTFIGKLFFFFFFFFTRFLDFEIRWNDDSDVPTFFNDVSLCSYSPPDVTICRFCFNAIVT